jgi:hypothetical protein
MLTFSTADAIKVSVEIKMPHKTPASRSEGAPDFTTAAAAGELPAAEPTVTQASPDLPAAEKPVPELAGSDLQPVEGCDPEGGGPKEPIPHARPEEPQSNSKLSRSISAPTQGQADAALPERSAGND